MGKEEHKRPGNGKTQDIQVGELSQGPFFGEYTERCIERDEPDENGVDQLRHLQRWPSTLLACMWDIPWMVRIAMTIPAIKSEAEKPTKVNP